MRKLFLTVILLCCWSTIALAQKPDSSELLRQLLALPAPTPRLSDPPTEEQKQQAAEKAAAKGKVPAEDAPADELREYFTDLKRTSNKDGLPPAIKQRLIDIFADEPGNMLELAPYLSVADAEAVKASFDKLPDDPNTRYTRTQLRKWLVHNSNYFLDELLAQVNKVKDNTENGNVDKSEELTGLAKVDWSRAEPLLQTLAETGQQRSATLAVSLLYQHAAETGDASAEDKFRTRLQTIASDRNFPGWARDKAVETLSVTKWSGRDDWYLSLLQDESLISLHDGHYGFSPLNTLFNSDPDKWIPIMTKLVSGTNRTVQQTAASCLVRSVIQSPRRDAILPVLRWLSDPDWIPISGSERAWFMQKMDEVEMPESVPGLIWIIENEEGNAQWAARTIAHYKDPRAIPALKQALVRSDEDDRRMILEGLLACGGVSEAEAIDALEQYAAKLMTPEGREEVEKYYYPRDSTLPVPLSIGRFLASSRAVPPEIVRAVLMHAARIRNQHPELSRSLLQIAQEWQSREVDLNIVKRIAAGTADAETISKALERRARLRESLGADLQVLLRAGGVVQAIGSIMLDDSALSQTILSSADQPAQIALLASARLTQTPLPVTVVGPLIKSKNTLLAQAAERYLLAEDSDEAQTLLWQRHPGEAFITGWRENIQLLAGNDFDALGKQEEPLRHEVLKENGPVEIFALLANTANYHRVLRVYPDHAVYTYYEDPARYRERVISKAELAAFKQFVATEEIEELGPQIGFCHHDCWVSELVFLKKERGRRVFSQQGFNGWDELLKQLDGLGSGSDSKYHYALESEIKGLEVLYAGDKLNVKDVWQHDDEVRVLAERIPTEAEVNERDKPEPEGEDEDEDKTDNERRRRQATFDRSLLSWRKFAGGSVTSGTGEPEGYVKFDENRFPLEPDDALSLLRDELDLKGWAADTFIIGRNFEGLWKQVAGSKPVRIKEGAYLNPVITPDGKWVAVSKTDDNWGNPNYVVRINLETGREFRVNVEPSDDLRPIAFLPQQGRILLRRARDDYYGSTDKPVGPARPEYYLLTPNTGETRLVTGEFAPLVQEGKRSLQTTGKVDEFWAAIPDSDKGQTQVGRYNLKTFSFTPVLTIPHIVFNSFAMWVDEKHNKIYVAYKNQLISIPLQRPGAAVSGN